MDIYKMKLGEVLRPDGKINTLILRVPGGWIYRFWEVNQGITPDGRWSENYIYNSVFVPYNEEFIKNEDHKQT